MSDDLKAGPDLADSLPAVGEGLGATMVAMDLVASAVAAVAAPAFQELPIPQPSVGRIVRYRLPHDMDRAGEERPAIITRVVAGLKVNLVVFLDGPNDGGPVAPAQWVGTVDYSERAAARTWAWPVRG